MKIKFNPTGTHLKDGKLKIRLDFYPDSSSKTYSQQYVDVFAREFTEEEKKRDENGTLTEQATELRKLVPTKKQLNPFLCHFISINPDMTKGELISYIRTTFNKKTLSELDDILSVDNRKNELHLVLKDKLGNSNGYSEEINIKDINKRFTNTEEVI